MTHEHVPLTGALLSSGLTASYPRDGFIHPRRRRREAAPRTVVVRGALRACGWNQLLLALAPPSVWGTSAVTKSFGVYLLSGPNT